MKNLIARSASPGRFLLLGIVLLPLCTPALPAQDDVLFRAMEDELTRSVQRLKLKDQGRPYFVEYRVNETRGYRISGSFGALTASQPYHHRSLAVDVRIGDYGFDNTGFFSRADLFGSLSSMPPNLVIENNYMALRRDLWLATDKAYKGSVEQMASKRGYLESRVEKDTIPDFSREPLTNLMDPLPASAFDTAAWQARVRRWSGLFRNYPQIQSSDVSFSFTTPALYLINSEGSRVRTGLLRVNLSIRLEAQATDGTPLRRSRSLLLDSPEAAPSDAEMEEMIRSLALELVALRDAPVLDRPYIGPVMFVEEAACLLFQQTLVPHLSGSRLPLNDDPSMHGILGGESDLAKRMNLRVMPRYLSVRDDPSAASAHGALLAGHYKVDDQGVAARNVSLIENGVVKGLLSSRRPGAELRNSNGHGRGTLAAGTAIGNLFVETSDGKSYTEMKEELIGYCRDLGLEYGIIVRRMGESSSSFSGGGISFMIGSEDEEGEMTTATRVYVADGREEPLRGVRIDPPDLRSLKDIVAAGNEYTVLNTSVRPHGVADFSSVQAGIIAPPVLLEEVQINPPSAPKQKPALLSHPYFEKK